MNPSLVLVESSARTSIHEAVNKRRSCNERENQKMGFDAITDENIRHLIPPSNTLQTKILFIYIFVSIYFTHLSSILLLL